MSGGIAGGACGCGKLGNSHAQLLSNGTSGASINQRLITFFPCSIGDSSLFCGPALFFGARSVSWGTNVERLSREARQRGVARISSRTVQRVVALCGRRDPQRRAIAIQQYHDGIAAVAPRNRRLDERGNAVGAQLATLQR